jgi:sec-independent protein translocase protein TatA
MGGKAMGFGRIGATELILILAIALVIFGPSKLPEIGRTLGKAISEFKAQTSKVTEDLKVDSDDEKKN